MWGLADYHMDFGLYSERDSYWKVLGKRNYLLYFLKEVVLDVVWKLTLIWSMGRGERGQEWMQEAQ